MNNGKKTYRWGIIGPGRIAETFAAALPLAEQAELYAVASRDRHRAESFAKRYGASKVFDDYTALASDPEVDVVYIATPHVFHAEQALLCLEQGKAVLCEKPMAINVMQMQKMISCSKANGAFLMEGVWTRFLPAIERMLQLIKDGTIGDVLDIRADFCFEAPFDPRGRLYNPALAGGALLDVGVYPLFLAHLLMGTPKEIVSTAKFSATGVDESCRMILKFGKGRSARLESAISQYSPLTAHITGTLGKIILPEPWYKTDTLILQTIEGQATINPEPMQNGFEYEIREVQRCLDMGLIESPKMSHAFSLALCETMDTIRRQIGLRYPCEKELIAN